MPDRAFRFISKEGIDIENDGIFVDVSKRLVSLRPTNDDFEYDMMGTLKPTYLDLPTWCPTVFENFFGFLADCNLNGGEIKYQISPDAGSTFLYHDGTEWITATPLTDKTKVNSREEVEANIDTYPSTWDTLRIRVHLFPSEDGKSPILGSIILLVNYRSHEMVEDVYRSVKKYIKETLEFTFPVEFHDFELSDTIDFEYSTVGRPADIESSLLVKEPIWVFNLDEDPKERNNLFESYDGVSIIKLKKLTSGTIKVVFTSEPEIHIQTDYDFVPLSSHPSITLQVVSVVRSEWDGPGNFPCYELNYSKLLAKAREGLRKYQVKVRFRSYASKTVDASMFTGAVRRLIEQTDRVTSLNYDSPMEALWGTESNSDWVSKNLFAQNYTPTFIWEDWQAQGKAKEVPLVDTPENGGGVILNIDTIDC